MPRVWTELDFAVGDDVMANAVMLLAAAKMRNRINATGPMRQRMFETWVERRLLYVAIERPTIRQSMHHLARRAPVRVTGDSLAEDRADLHDKRSPQSDKQKSPDCKAGTFLPRSASGALYAGVTAIPQEARDG